MGAQGVTMCVLLSGLVELSLSALIAYFVGKTESEKYSVLLTRMGAQEILMCILKSVKSLNKSLGTCFVWTGAHEIGLKLDDIWFNLLFDSSFNIVIFKLFLTAILLDCIMKRDRMGL